MARLAVRLGKLNYSLFSIGIFGSGIHSVDAKWNIIRVQVQILGYSGPRASVPKLVLYLIALIQCKFNTTLPSRALYPNAQPG